MIDAERCYQIWTASHLHCNTNYDAIKYQFKIKRVKEFSTHKDRFVYQTIANKLSSAENVIYFSLSNLCKNVHYIRDTTFENYFEFQKIQDGLLYWFEQDINKIAIELDRWQEHDKNTIRFFINSSKDNLPRIVTWYRQNKISFQTIAILQKLYLFLDQVVCDSLIYNDTLTFLKKSSKLLYLGDKKHLLKSVVENKILTIFNLDISQK